MRELSIVVVDDQVEVGQAITRDLAHLDKTQVFVTGSADEARAAIEDLCDHDQLVAALLVDCVMPGESGVELLQSLAHHQQIRHTRRIMITGQATQQDTIAAINSGDLHRYVEKPWQAEVLQRLVREELTRYVISAGIDAEPYNETLIATLLRDAAAQDLGQF